MATNNKNFFHCHSFENYKNLDGEEHNTIKMYHLNYDPTTLANWIQSNKEMSQGMRNFIADVLTGKIKRPRGKKASTIQRDIKIWRRMNARKDEEKNLSLRENSEGGGLADIVAKEFGIGGNEPGEIVIKAMQRIDKILDEDRCLFFMMNQVSS